MRTLGLQQVKALTAGVASSGPPVRPLHERSPNALSAEREAPKALSDSRVTLAFVIVVPPGPQGLLVTLSAVGISFSLR